MRILLVVAAVALALPAAAEAQQWGGSNFIAESGAQGRGDGRNDRRGRPDFERPGDRNDRRDGRRRGDVVVIGGYGYGGYGNERVSDRAWQPDSFNDWWHDRPSRAYPAWMARNSQCERMWWSGGGWRC